ncbi:bacteriocin immunity protein [Clostridium thermobutyricum]|uniref:bacteriocin immunity protein n=1 Tax=Clostridium thermobutyricum TaxID=29372 RepID=UPI0018A92B41|nr:bacteriocin immunity protein [Clostridium thermobutyricum]
MRKKEKRILAEKALLSRVYDLIIDKQTFDDERDKLIEFKNAVENGKDFEREVMYLAEDLRKLSLLKFKNKKNLSPEVGKFYMDISSTGFLKKQFGTGMVAISFLAK